MKNIFIILLCCITFAAHAQHDRFDTTVVVRLLIDTFTPPVIPYQSASGIIYMRPVPNAHEHDVWWDHLKEVCYTIDTIAIYKGEDRWLNITKTHVKYLLENGEPVPKNWVVIEYTTANLNTVRYSQDIQLPR